MKRKLAFLAAVVSVALLLPQAVLGSDNQAPPFFASFSGYGYESETGDSWNYNQIRALSLSFPGCASIYEPPLSTFQPEEITDFVLYRNNTPLDTRLGTAIMFSTYTDDDGTVYQCGVEVHFTSPVVLPGVYYATGKYRGQAFSTMALTVTPPDTVVAKSSVASLRIDRQAATLNAYLIGGNNFVKLRDIAMLLNGTGKHFEVLWDAESQTINLYTGKAYTPTGAEMLPLSGDDGLGKLNIATILLDGAEVEALAYNIDGSNYFRLRDLAALLNFYIAWDGYASTVIIDTAADYSPLS